MELTPNARRRALAVLGLVGTPTAAEVSAAYRRRARDTHPDTADSNDGGARFAAVLDAYRLLSDRPQDDNEPPGSEPTEVAPPRGAAAEALRWRPPVVPGPVRFTPTPTRRRHHG